LNPAENRGYGNSGNGIHQKHSGTLNANKNHDHEKGAAMSTRPPRRRRRKRKAEGETKVLPPDPIVWVTAGSGNRYVDLDEFRILINVNRGNTISIFLNEEFDEETEAEDVAEQIARDLGVLS
jgi:hypothetical protein